MAGYIVTSDTKVTGVEHGLKHGTLKIHDLPSGKNWALLRINDDDEWQWHRKDSDTPLTGWVRAGGAAHDKLSALGHVGYNKNNGVASTIFSPYSGDGALRAWTVVNDVMVGETEFATGWGSTNRKISCCVGDDGKLHGFAIVNGALVMRSTDTARTSLGAEVELIASGVVGGAEGIVYATNWSDGTDSFIRVFYYIGQIIYERRIEDGLATSTPGNWSVHTVRDMAATGDILDDHFGIAVSSSNVAYITYKDGADDIWSQKHDPVADVWKSQVLVESGKTRPEIGICDGEVFVAYIDDSGGGGPSASYKSSPLTGVLDFGTATIALQDSPAEFRMLSLADTEAPSNRGLDLIGYQDDDHEHWCAELAPAGPPPEPPAAIGGCEISKVSGETSLYDITITDTLDVVVGEFRLYKQNSGLPASEELDVTVETVSNLL